MLCFFSIKQDTVPSADADRLGMVIMSDEGRFPHREPVPRSVVAAHSQKSGLFSIQLDLRELPDEHTIDFFERAQLFQLRQPAAHRFVPAACRFEDQHFVFQFRPIRGPCQLQESTQIPANKNG